MKTTIIVLGVVLGFLLVVGIAEAGAKLLKGNKIAEVGGINPVELYEVNVSSSTTCYVSTMGKYGSHAISCVK